MNQNKAISIAKAAHAGQTRRGGEDYFNHVHRVAVESERMVRDMSFTYEKFTKDQLENLAFNVGILHDSLEDADSWEKRKEIESNIITCINEKRGAERSVLARVEMLTRGEAETYDEYFTRLIQSNDPVVLIVKFNDIIDNLSDSPSEKQKQKYKKALQLIVPALVLSGTLESV